MLTGHKNNTHHRGGAEVARGAHNPEDRCSNHLSGIFQFVWFIESFRHMLSDVKHSNTHHRCGAEGARGAHNSEVTGSKPVSGIYHHFASVH